MFNFGSASQFFATSSLSYDYGTNLFTEYLPFVFLLIGVVAAVTAIVYLRKVVAGSIKRVGGGHKGMKHRRRR